MKNKKFIISLKFISLISLFCIGIALIIGSGGPPPVPVSLNIEQIDPKEARNVFLETIMEDLKYNSTAWPSGYKEKHFDRFSEGNYKFVGVKNTLDEKTFIYLFASKRQKSFYAIIIDFYGGDPQIIPKTWTTGDFTGAFTVDFKNIHIFSAFLGGEPKINGNQVKLTWEASVTKDYVSYLGVLSTTLLEHIPSVDTYLADRKYLFNKYSNSHYRNRLADTVFPTFVMFYFENKKKAEEFVTIFNGAFPGKITIH